MATFTVTVTSQGSAVHNGIAVLPRIYTGATESGGNSASGTPAGATGTLSFTPAGNNSLIFNPLASGLVGSGNYSAASNNALYFGLGDQTNILLANTGHYTGTVNAGVSLTVGASLVGSTTITSVIYEILSTTGTSTPVLATSPVGSGATVTNTVTSAALSVPANAVVAVSCACVSTSGTGVSSFTITDNANLGLVWTSRGFLSGANGSAAGVFTTTLVPPPPPRAVYQMRSFG